MFEADFSACDVHLHNLRSVSLDGLRVWRPIRRYVNSSSASDPLEFRSVAAAAKFSFPILWLSGYYKYVCLEFAFGMFV